MPRPQFYCLIFSLLSLTASMGQSNVLFIQNSQDIDPDRYQGIKGSPYLFDLWTKGNVIGLEGEVYTNVLLNYNGYSDLIEVRLNNRFIELDEKLYLGIEITSGEDDDVPLVLRRGIHTHFGQRFVHLLHQGDRVCLIKDFNVILGETTIEDVGQTKEIKRFARKTSYYLLIDTDLQPLKLKKKNILALLGHEKDLEAFAKKNRLDIQTESGLAQVLTYYETLL